MSGKVYTKLVHASNFRLGGARCHKCKEQAVGFRRFKQYRKVWRIFPRTVKEWFEYECSSCGDKGTLP